MNDDASQGNRYWIWGGSKEKAIYYSQRGPKDFKSEASASWEDLIPPSSGALPLVVKWTHGKIILKISQYQNEEINFHI